jgi:hypothetical protein
MAMQTSKMTQRENTPKQAVARLSDGRWVSGVSPNPGGRPKLVGEIGDLARQYTEVAIETLVSIAKDGKQEASRVSAAIALLDRGWGRPTQAVTSEDGQALVVHITRFSDGEAGK